MIHKCASSWLCYSKEIDVAVDIGLTLNVFAFVSALCRPAVCLDYGISVLFHSLHQLMYIGKR